MSKNPMFSIGSAAKVSISPAEPGEDITINQHTFRGFKVVDKQALDNAARLYPQGGVVTPEDLAQMTAPKIYVPAPGRPPEWVVDLMVEGRVSYSRHYNQWSVDFDDNGFSENIQKSQAIRLNEDGSLEIIDAPKEEAMPREDMEDLPGLLRANAELEESPCCAGQMRAAADDIETLMAMVTNVALAIEAFPSLRRLSAERTFTKTEVVEAMNAEAKKWPNVAMVQVALRQLAGNLNFEWGWRE